MRKILLAILLCLFIAAPSFGANTTALGSSSSVIQITGLDADWIWATEMAALGFATRDINATVVTRIVFYPSAAADRMIVHDGGVDTAAYFDSGIVSGSDDPRTKDYPGIKPVQLVIDISDCTLGTAANAKVLIFIEQRE